MSKRNRPASFKQQMRQSMEDLRAIMARGQSPGGDGRFTVRSVAIVEPGAYDAATIRRTRRSLKLSQAVFAQLLGVSTSLVRSWELGTRSPAPIARRLLDEVRADPGRFARLVRSSNIAGARPARPTARAAGTRSRKVA